MVWKCKCGTCLEEQLYGTEMSIIWVCPNCGDCKEWFQMTYNEALEKAIKCLRQYADDDDLAGLHGAGCYSNPNEVVDEWIKNINDLLPRKRL